MRESSELRNGDQVRLSIGDASVDAPVWIMPGQAADCVVALLGFGRRDVGAVGERCRLRLLSADRPQRMRRRSQKAAGRVDLASTDHHNLIFNAAGDIVQHGTLAEYGKDPHFLAVERAASRISIAGSPRDRPPGR